MKPLKTTKENENLRYKIKERKNTVFRFEKDKGLGVIGNKSFLFGCPVSC